MSKQDEHLIKGFLDAKLQEENLLKLVQELVDEVKKSHRNDVDMDKAFEILVAAREIRIALNLCWSAYTKRDLPGDLGGSAPAVRPVEALEAVARVVEAAHLDEHTDREERKVRRIPRRPS